jgi:hypothetical protein
MCERMNLHILYNDLFYCNIWHDLNEKNTNRSDMNYNDSNSDNNTKNKYITNSIDIIKNDDTLPFKKLNFLSI